MPSAQTTVERLDHATIAQIRDEGLSRSQVMDHIGWLADVYGPRLTGGPGIQQASEWTLKIRGVGQLQAAPPESRAKLPRRVEIQRRATLCVISSTKRPRTRQTGMIQ